MAKFNKNHNWSKLTQESSPTFLYKNKKIRPHDRLPLEQTIFIVALVKLREQQKPKFLEWKFRNGNKYKISRKIYEEKIRKNRVVKKRKREAKKIKNADKILKRNNQCLELSQFAQRRFCNENWEEHDTYIKNQYATTLGCRPPYLNSDGNISLCYSAEKMKEVKFNYEIEKDKDI